MILALGKKIFIKPIHLKFCGVLSVIIFLSKLYMSKHLKYSKNTFSDEELCKSIIFCLFIILFSKKFLFIEFSKYNNSPARIPRGEMIISVQPKLCQILAYHK